MWALLLSRFLFFIQVKERYSPGYLSFFFSLYLSISTNYLLGEKGVCTKLTWWSECSLVFQPALKVFQRKWKDKRWQSKSIFLSCFLSFEDVGFVLLMLTINCPVFYASLFASFFAAFSSLPKRTQQAHSAAAAASVAVLLACLLSWAGLWLMNSFLNGQFFLCRLHSQSSKYANDDAAEHTSTETKANIFTSLFEFRIPHSFSLDLYLSPSSKHASSVAKVMNSFFCFFLLMCRSAGGTKWKVPGVDSAAAADF